MSDIIYTNLYDLIEINREKIEDIKEQYLLLLSNLTVTDNIETKLFEENINKISEMGAIIVGFIKDSSDNIEIIASGTIIIEPKIIRKGKSVGHIEDIVVAPHMRSQGISQEILGILKLFAKESNCYKVILDCSEEVKNVYKKNGFEIKGVQMAEYF
jgi:glucosamine-phosphate N-acetyltransferase